MHDARVFGIFYLWWRQILAHLARRGAAATSVHEFVATLALASSPAPG
jgi:hypothetical protein